MCDKSASTNSHFVSRAHALHVQDIYLGDVTTKRLEFSSPFTLISTAVRRTKIHALVLYFDTFFETTGSPIPSDTTVHVARDGSELAEVWPVGRRHSVPRRQSLKSRQGIISFSTGPRSAPTHWKHTIFLLREPITVTEGTAKSSLKRYVCLYLHLNNRNYCDRDVPLPKEQNELERAGC